MDVAELVERLHREDDLGDIEPCVVLRKTAHVVQQVAKVATRQVFLREPQSLQMSALCRVVLVSCGRYHAQIEMFGVLEGGDEVDHPGILLAGLELGHHFLFSLHARHLGGTITTHDVVSSP